MADVRVPFSLRLTPTDHAKIKLISQKENRSIANMIETLVKREIERYEKENGEIELTEEEIYPE